MAQHRRSLRRSRATWDDLHRPSFALRDAGQGREQGYPKRRSRAPHSKIAATCPSDFTGVDLEQRQRARRNSAGLTIGHRRGRTSTSR